MSNALSKIAHAYQLLNEDYIVEAQIDDAIAKAGLSSEKATIAKDIFKEIGSKVGYLKFMFQNGNFLKSGFADAINKFEKNKARIANKDINSYSSFNDLEKVVDGLEMSKSEKSAEIDNDAPIVAENSKFIVREILSNAAAVKYGSGTGTGKDDAWCVAVPGAPGRQKLSYYTNDGEFPCWYILSKTDINEKYCIIPSATDFRVTMAFQDEKNLMLSERQMADAIGNDLYDKLKSMWKELLSDSDVDKILDRICGRGRWERDKKGVVNVNGNVTITGKYSFSKLPVKFGKVRGSFLCSNIGLTSLEGSPTYVKENFDVSHNDLKSLKDAPVVVKGEFKCDHNKLDSLDGVGNTKVGGSFWCDFNKLKNLEGAPLEVEGNFVCRDNGLKTLKGAQDMIVGNNFLCDNNDLENLDYIPKSIGSSMSCRNNPRLPKNTKKPDNIGGYLEISNK